MYLESEFKDDLENIFVGLRVLLYHHLYLHGGGGGGKGGEFLGNALSDARELVVPREREGMGGWVKRLRGWIGKGNGRMDWIKRVG